ncbi:MAG: winged helix-turn-helix domain-containing protein [Sulfurovum sp.]|nr:winged helix-turn-helix domain-containing protein [Sulfurovum sp.]
MARITESELILPALHVMNDKENGEITTSELINELENLIEIDEEDKGIIQGRKDSYFTQKVRNLKSHNTLTKKGFATYSNGKFKITEKGKEHLSENEEKLKLIIAEEKFLQQNSLIITEYFSEFNRSIENIKELAEITITNNSLQPHYFNMLYSSVITSLETYLSDALKFNLANNEEFLIKFVETFQDFKNVKCDFNDIFNLCNSIESIVEEGLRSFLYHNLPKIQGIYKATFDIKFLSISELMQSISIRHDLVHRNGKDKNGTLHNITKDNVLELCNKTLSFVQNIEEQFNTLTRIEDNE